MSNGDGITFLTAWDDLDIHDFSLVDHMNVQMQDGVTGNDDGVELRGGIHDTTVIVSNMTGGTFHFECSPDSGTTWEPLRDSTGAAVTYTADGEYAAGYVNATQVRLRAAGVTAGGGGADVWLCGTRGPVA